MNYQFLSNNEVHIWMAHLEKPYYWSRANSKIDILSEKEKTTLFNYSNLSHRKLYLLSRVMMRELLSCYLNIPPKEINFSTGKYGKPFVIHPIKKPIYFNLSHSNQGVAVGITSVSPIGIDIEYIHRKIEIDTITEYCFSNLEKNYFYQQKEKKRLFFKIWTLKEAYIKNLGYGLNDQLIQSATFYLNPQNNQSSYFMEEDFTDHFSFTTKTVFHDYQLSAVVNFKPYKFRLMNW